MTSFLEKGNLVLSHLEERLDVPTIPWKQYITTFIIAEYFFEEYLEYRQYQVLNHVVVPEALKGVVSKETYDKSQEYSRAKAKFGFLSRAWNQAINLTVIYYNVLPYLWELTRTWQRTHAGSNFQGEMTHSVLFYFASQVPLSFLQVPWSVYQTFVIEENFGFNKQTPALFFKDFAITQALLAVIGTPLLIAFLKIIDYFGKKTLAFYVMLFLVTVQVVMITVYPVLIQPLFNKLEPLQEGEVKIKTEELARKLKFPLGKLWVIDGSKRSAHSNAYFYGLPFLTKQIVFTLGRGTADGKVIYDTLIASSEPMEVVAVLAHELGHWVNWDTSRQLLIGEVYLAPAVFLQKVYLFAFFLIFSTFIENKSLYRSFGFIAEQPALVGLLLFNDVWQPVDHCIKWVMQISSRRNEYGADKFAQSLGYKDELARALIKLQVKNLSAMDADWLYSAYNHSHPILVERLRALGYKGGEDILKTGTGETEANGKVE